MKRLGILVLLFILLTLGSKCCAQSQYTDLLTQMEKSLFGIDYNNQNDDARLKRIEKMVYGATSSRTTKQRISRLSNDLAADLMGKEIKPKTDTFAEDEDTTGEKAMKEDVPKADPNVNYPIVNALEKTVFNKEFKAEEINKRLSNLEQKVFKRTYNNDLNTRVERLKTAVMPTQFATKSEEEEYNSDDIYPQKSAMDETAQFQDDGFTDRFKTDKNTTGFGSNLTQIPEDDSQKNALDEYSNDADILMPLSTLEKQVLKKTYPNDVVSNRLLRMEIKVFNSTFTEDDEQTRLERIASAYQAKKSSSKYDNNKFAQHSAAAMQIGAILLMILAAIL